MAASRVSLEIDLIHDTDEALEASWDTDRQLLETHGFEVHVIRERRAFVEAEVGKDRETVLVQWARDSAYRFFPLVTHPDFGLALHPFDLATNKVLALVGRLEVRDWVDLIHASDRLQPLGYLAWAAYCARSRGSRVSFRPHPRGNAGGQKPFRREPRPVTTDDPRKMFAMMPARASRASRPG